MTKPRVLIIEDDPDGRRSVEDVVQDCGCDAVAVECGKDGVALYQQQPFDLVLSDLVLPDIDGVEVLSQIIAIDHEAIVLIMTAYGSVDTAVRALKAGAYDYATKPLDLDDLQTRVARALETRRLRTEVAQLSETVQSEYGTSSMVAESQGMQNVLRKIESLANIDATVLVQGESGTGKELVARALHYDGKRRTGPFVAVNCGAFTETLLESALFGHEKGAFTGATARQKGAFERADGGTIFLDEIGDAPPPVQVKLLRVLEDRQVTRVGGQEPIDLDVRLISASNKDLNEMTDDGDFREDLLYRLKVVTISIPPLRERINDIPPLVDRFVADACASHGRHITAVAPKCYETLKQHHWPGNIRQLKNVVESSVVMARGSELQPTDLEIDNRKPASPTNGLQVPDGLTMAQLEKEILLQSLVREDGNRTIVADKLGISRRTIQRKIKEYDLPF